MTTKEREEQAFKVILNYYTGGVSEADKDDITMAKTIAPFYASVMHLDVDKSIKHGMVRVYEQAFTKGFEEGYKALARR